MTPEEHIAIGLLPVVKSKSVFFQARLLAGSGIAAAGDPDLLIFGVSPRVVLCVPPWP